MNMPAPFLFAFRFHDFIRSERAVVAKLGSDFDPRTKAMLATAQVVMHLELHQRPAVEGSDPSMLDQRRHVLDEITQRHDVNLLVYAASFSFPLAAESSPPIHRVAAVVPTPTVAVLFGTVGADEMTAAETQAARGTDRYAAVITHLPARRRRHHRLNLPAHHLKECFVIIPVSG
jgi:hypothetical protein